MYSGHILLYDFKETLIGKSPSSDNTLAEIFIHHSTEHSKTGELTLVVNSWNRIPLEHSRGSAQQMTFTIL